MYRNSAHSLEKTRPNAGDSPTRAITALVLSSCYCKYHDPSSNHQLFHLVYIIYHFLRPIHSLWTPLQKYSDSTTIRTTMRALVFSAKTEICRRSMNFSTRFSHIIQENGRARMEINCNNLFHLHLQLRTHRTSRYCRYLKSALKRTRTGIRYHSPS